MIISSYNENNKKIRKTFETIDSYNSFFRKVNKRDIVASVSPSKIVAIGLNYHDHAIEMKKQPPKEPLIFLKAPSIC